MSLRKMAVALVIAIICLSVASSARSRDIMRSLGVSLFPGATQRPDGPSYSGRKATLSLQDIVVGEASAEAFISDQSPDKVLSFYRDEFKRLGTVTECKNGKNTKVHVRLDPDAISDPSTCQPFNFGAGESEIKAFHDGEQFIISVEATSAGSEFAIVHVQSARKCNPRECSTMI